MSTFRIWIRVPPSIEYPQLPGFTAGGGSPVGLDYSIAAARPVRAGGSAGWHHRCVIFSVACQLTRCLLDCLMLLTRRETSKDAELLVLRHENAVLLAGSAISPPTGCGSRRCPA